jgi:hypothetical protein
VLEILLIDDLHALVVCSEHADGGMQRAVTSEQHDLLPVALGGELQAGVSSWSRAIAPRAPAGR